MLTLRCTQKLLKELRRPSRDISALPGILGEWHANLLRVERRKCVLFTNDATLYSIFIPGVRREHFLRLGEVFGQELFRCLNQEAISQRAIERVLDEIQEVEFGKSNNRSVLGSMNDLAYQLGWIIQSRGGLEVLSLNDVHYELNRIPMSAIKPNIYSIDALRQRLSRNTGPVYLNR